MKNWMKKTNFASMEIPRLTERNAQKVNIYDYSNTLMPIFTLVKVGFPLYGFKIFSL